MANKIEDYVQLAGQTAAEITKSTENWEAFLATVSKLYRYSFTDQLLIHAQRPKATACAEFDIWSRRMKFYVRRGSKGIALVDVRNGRPGLRYVFDISDTGRKKDSYNLYLWQYKEEYQEAITKTLEKHFGISGSDGIELQLCHTATSFAKSYWNNYRQDIIDEAEGSLLEGLDERSLRSRFCTAAALSITYVLLLRCGFNPDNYLSGNTFQGISDFNTQRMIKVLGYAVSQASGDILHQIAIAVFACEREKKAARHTEDPQQQQDSSETETDNHKQPSSFILTVDKGQPEQPSIQDIYEQYKPVVKEFLLNDTAYRNACKNSDKENALLEGLDAVKRAALSIKSLEFMKLYYDLADFHNHMQQEVLAETYPELSHIPEPHTDTEEAAYQEEPAAASYQEESNEPDQESELHPDECAAEESVSEQHSEATPEEEPSPVPHSEEHAAETQSAADVSPEENPDPEPEPEQDQPVILNESDVEVLSPVRASNFKITDDRLEEGSAKEKFDMNMYAIVALKVIEGENRTATPEEQEILSRYAGWGGIPDAFEKDRADWSREYQELQSALTPEEYASARASVLTSFYTGTVIIKAIYAALESMGFRSGNILEPSCGIGNFFGLLPESMSKSKLYGVELDSISGRIAKLLYPKAKISVCAYEKTDFPNNFFDLAIGNVPFGPFQVSDPAYDHLKFSIHNYFFAKTLDLVRPGGIIAFITSRYMMDAKDTTVRSYLAERADLLGAVRLPRNAFKANAGTEVVSDIIFLQKRSAPAAAQAVWEQAEPNGDGFLVNCYFQSHPEMVLGRQASRSTQYGKLEYTVFPIPDADLSDQLHEAVSHIHGRYQEAVSVKPENRTESVSMPDDSDVKNYSFTIMKGDVYYRENSVLIKQKLSQTAKSRMAGMIHLRDCVHQLIRLQMDEAVPDSEIAKKQAELNRLYDAFTRKYGLINQKSNRIFAKDSAYYLLCSLENLDDNGNLKSKADMFTKRTIRPHKAVTHVDTASEALTVSIGERARVDLAYMSQLTGKSESELIKDLQGVIFHDPADGEWNTADEYLSGNVRRKLRIAQKYAEQNPEYEANVKALEAAQPKDLDASEIEVRIGATWIDKSYIQQFMVETLNTPDYLKNKIQVSFCKETGEWFISNKTSISNRDITTYTTYGTSRANAYKILEDSLNLRDVRIYDTVTDAEGKEKRVLNAHETTLAAQKQSALREAFKDWIFKDPERRQDLCAKYNGLFNSTRPREYDGRHIIFAGMNPEIEMQVHQANGVARILYGGNTLLAHVVGAGKTFEIVAACMESKRLGLCHKSMIVVPNHLTEQTAAEFLRLYPAASILVTTKKDFETANRKKFCARIATGNYDAVIIGHSQFEKIPLSLERQEMFIQEQIDEITAGIAEIKASNGERFTIKQLERTRKNLYARLEKLQANHRKDDVVTFEQLGVDMLFVDESDNYKNLYLYTKMRNVAGIAQSEAQKSSDMFAKCRYLDEITGGRGIVFATGTPISNSMTEMYVRP